jgi:hypothetical protein
MNIRDKIIADNFSRCNNPMNKLLPSEQKVIADLRTKSELNLKEFNRLAEIATTSEHRGMKERTFAVLKCPTCKKEVLWLTTSLKRKKILINADTYKGEDYYTPSKHFCHWNECNYR